MCRSLSSRVVLSYALQDKQSVSATELVKKRSTLIDTLGDVLADVSFVSLHAAVRRSGGALRLEGDGEGYKISRDADLARSVSMQGGLLPKRYLDAFLESSFSSAEKNEIERVLKG